jgi:hypothetical protein
MKRTIAWFLFDTRPGDLLLRALEQVAGLAVVEVGEIADVEIAATAKGRAAATSRAPASGD